MKNANFVAVTTFYKFSPIPEDRLESLRSEIEALCQRFAARGLMIMGVEGVNTTMSLQTENLAEFQKQISELLGMGPLKFKDSLSPKHPFRDFRAKIKAEIVTLARTDLVPSGQRRHLSPEEWSQALHDDVVVIDTRNSYEYELGHFKNALNPETEEFTEFPDYLQKAQIPKDKKILIYCTGGIRCEKAILEMEEQGYRNVYQLEGGILNYLAQKPNEDFVGECFVFDYRVAVDQNLNPTHIYRLCPHCGQPGKTPIQCIQCGEDSINCDKCLSISEEHKTCSKNCAHHFRMGHVTRRKHKDSKRPYVS